MATQTVVFPWEPGLTNPTARLTLTTNDATVFNSVTCVERTNAPGIYVATFANVGTGDYYITPREDGVDVEGVGIVHGVSNVASTFFESELVAPGSVTLSEQDKEDIINGVILGIQDIPNFTLEVISPTNENGDVEIIQGDDYSEGSRRVSAHMTGTLPDLKTPCKLRILTGGVTYEFEGAVNVITPNADYYLYFPITSEQSLTLIPGSHTHQMIVTFDTTEKDWTPFEGNFTIKPRIPAPAS